MGEIEFQGKSKVEKTSGVWIDGQYLGYLDELKGSKRILLLPGTHKRGALPPEAARVALEKPARKNTNPWPTTGRELAE